ncbi:hypothetical protein YOLOSWAG_17 [Erwinia phage vB_EamM_Yoloswag]|uniref:Asparagine synthase n=1 Tax=Erwinia phage vB_EamM_Yoloswag TaxID=1958956 RepID=A0A1S6L2U2_9CAUD|nr:hypothetical protein HOR66_gp017 [Erwinia phage vB_EamM_Yoloswag]AQT28504.1 hypothetical protein YOLOSWAG_17 [Erwinia phage vB_EamM_Yoloswag]
MSTTAAMREKIRAGVIESHNKPVDMRQALMDTLAWIPKDDQVTVFMSGGIDSHACLFAAIDLGLKVNVLSFTLDTHESADFKSARHAAEVFDLKFIPIVLPTNEQHLKSWVKFAVHKLGLSNKSEIECSWPLYSAIRALEQMGETKHIVLGLGGDSYFLMAKSASMHCKDLVLEQRRKATRRVLSQNTLVKREAFARGIYAHLPYYELGRVYAELQMETDFKKINSPQKSFYNQAFPEYRKRCKVRGHQNFQLGDTNISGIFSEVLLKSDWNTRNLKAITGIYNDVAAGII